MKKTLHFPVSGVRKDLSYRDSTLPLEDRSYSSPFALNVRGDCVFEGRRRGGSRPAFVALDGSVSIVGDGCWTWPNGARILLPDGGRIGTHSAFHGVVAPDGSMMVDQHSHPDVVCSKGSVPEDISAFAFFRARMFVASGVGWYASRTGEIDDWDYGGDMEDVARAVVGTCSLAGRSGDEIQAFIPVNDSHMFIATRSATWVLAGEPTTGTFNIVSEHVGVVAPNAWCRSDSTVYMLSTNGLYVIDANSSASLVSGSLPEDLKGITDAENPFLVYDPDGVGVHIFTDVGDWYYDIGNRAFWPISFSADGQRPKAGCQVVLDGVHTTVFLCSDGNWRTFDHDGDADDGGVPIPSEIAIGPIHVAPSEGEDGMVDEVFLSTAMSSADVGMAIAVGKYAEEAVDNARSGIFAGMFVLRSGWNRIVRPRSRGAWCVVVLTSTGRWAFESLHLICKQLGRLRHG